MHAREKILRRAHLVLVSAYRSRGKRVRLVSFTLYADDSGTSPSQQVAIATALIVPCAQIIRLEREWDTFRKKEGFSSFHTSECVARNPKSEFANWDHSKVRRVMARMRQITKKYAAAPAISMAVKKDYYDAVMPEMLRHHFGAYHYTWCLSYAIAYAEKSPIRLPFKYVFDWMGKPADPRRQEIDKVMDYCERAATEQGYAGDYTNYSFLHRKDTVGLQCVDQIAWTCYQFALKALVGTPMNEFAEEAWTDYGGHLASAGWLHAFSFRREALEKWVAAELSDGRSMKRFIDWSKHETERQARIRQLRKRVRQIAKSSPVKDQGKTGTEGENREKI